MERTFQIIWTALVILLLSDVTDAQSGAKIGTVAMYIGTAREGIVALNTLYDTGAHIWDDQSNRRYLASLRDLANSMAELNGNKQNLHMVLRDYIDEFHTSSRDTKWKDVSNGIVEVIKSLGIVVKKMAGDSEYFTEVSGIQNSAQLQADLKRQNKQYNKLLTIKPPSTEQELNELKGLTDRLDSLLAEVEKLEATLDRVISRP